MSIFWIIIRITYKNYESLILPKNAHEIIPIFFDHTLHANCAATTLLLALKIENKGKINPKKIKSKGNHKNAKARRSNKTVKVIKNKTCWIEKRRMKHL